MKSLLALLLFALPTIASESMSLDQCIQTALVHNRNLKALDARLEGANLQIRNSRTAYLPRLDFNSYYQYVSSVAELSVGPVTKTFGDHDAAGLSTGVSQLLFDGGQAHFRTKSMQQTHESAVANRRNTAADVAIGVARLYLGALGLEKARDALRLEEQSLIETRQIAQRLFDVGLLLQLDLITIDLRLATLQNRIEDLAKNIELTRLQLLNLMEMPLDTQLELTKDSTEINLQSSITVAFSPENRPSVLALAKQIEAGESREKSLGRTFLPTIAARGYYYYESPGIDKLKNEWMDYWTIGVNLNWMLWDFGIRARDRKVVRLENQALRENHDLAKEQANLLHKQSKLNLTSNDRQVVLSSKAMELAEKKLQWIRDRFGSGLATSTDIVTAYNEWESAKLSYEKSAIECRLGELELEYATGDITK
jgi:outer membrane protein TolC